MVLSWVKEDGGGVLIWMERELQQELEVIEFLSRVMNDSDCGLVAVVENGRGVAGRRGDGGNLSVDALRCERAERVDETVDAFEDSA